MNVFHPGCFASLKVYLLVFTDQTAESLSKAKFHLQRAAPLLGEHKGSHGCILKELYLGIGFFM